MNRKLDVGHVENFNGHLIDDCLDALLQREDSPNGFFLTL